MNAVIPFEDMKQMAAVLGRAKMFGKSPEDLLPLMLIAQAEGKHPAIAAQEYDIIQGRPAINSKSALARFQASGGKIQWTKRTDTEASAVFEHPAGGRLEVAWDMKRANQAGLTGKDNWKKYPAQMLSARVIAEGVRAVFPACLSGLYTIEEVQDFGGEQPMRDVTPTENSVDNRLQKEPTGQPETQAEPDHKAKEWAKWKADKYPSVRDGITESMRLLELEKGEVKAVGAQMKQMIDAMDWRSLEDLQQQLWDRAQERAREAVGDGEEELF